MEKNVFRRFRRGKRVVDRGSADPGKTAGNRGDQAATAIRTMKSADGSF